MRPINLILPLRSGRLKPSLLLTPPHQLFHCPAAIVQRSLLPCFRFLDIRAQSLCGRGIEFEGLRVDNDAVVFFRAPDGDEFALDFEGDAFGGAGEGVA